MQEDAGRDIKVHLIDVGFQVSIEGYSYRTMLLLSMLHDEASQSGGGFITYQRVLAGKVIKRVRSSLIVRQVGSLGSLTSRQHLFYNRSHT